MFIEQRQRKKRVYTRRELSEEEKNFLISSHGSLSYRELEPILKASHMTIRRFYIDLGLVKQKENTEQKIQTIFKVNKHQNWIV